MDIYKGVKTYVYQCRMCNHIETRQRVLDGQSCNECKGHTRMIALIKDNNKAVLLEPSNESLTGNKKEVAKLMERLNELGKSFDEVKAMQERSKSIDYDIQAITKVVYHQVGQLQGLYDTINSSLELFDTLIERKPEATKTIETLIESVENTDREVLKRFNILTAERKKLIDLKFQRAKLKIKLKEITGNEK